MSIFIGALIVICSIIIGYLLESGNLSVLIQPAEVIIIFGAATGALVISAKWHTLKDIFRGMLHALSGKRHFTKNDYLELLLLLHEIFMTIRKEGLISIEKDVDHPLESEIFSKYPRFLKNRRALTFLLDTLRTIMATNVSAYELESILDNEIDVICEMRMKPVKNLMHIADSLPGLGIVAAVLGVVLTMGKMNEPPEVIGHSVAAALVGTFMGVLLCYGFVSPVAKRLEENVVNEREYLTVIKTALTSFVSGTVPQISIEFARRMIPPNIRPDFFEIEEEIRLAKNKNDQ